MFLSPQLQSHLEQFELHDSDDRGGLREECDDSQEEFEDEPEELMSSGGNDTTRPSEFDNELGRLPGKVNSPISVVLLVGCGLLLGYGLSIWDHSQQCLSALFVTYRCLTLVFLAGLLYALSCWYHQKRNEHWKFTYMECKRVMNRTLGVMKALPLELSADNVSPGNLPSSSQLVSVKEAVEDVTNAIITMDQTYDLLRTATSLHLGLGLHSASTSRVERVALRRRSPPITSLMAVRQHWFQTMRCLYDILEEWVAVEDADFVKSTSGYGHDDSEVLTLARLRQARRDTVEILPRAFCAMLSRPDTASVSALSEFAVSATEYFASIHSPSRSSSAVSDHQQLTGQLLEDAESLKACLLVAHEEVTTKTPPGLWREVSNLLKLIQVRVDEISGQLDAGHGGDDDSETVMSNENGENGDIGATKTSVDTGDFVAEGASNNPRSEKQGPSNKILVYAGQGSVPKRSLRQTRKEGTGGTRSDFSRIPDFASPQLLMQELQNHINAMPQWEEVVASAEDDYCEESNHGTERTTVVDANVPMKEGVDDAGGRVSVANLFRQELFLQIQKHSESDIYGSSDGSEDQFE